MNRRQLLQTVAATAPAVAFAQASSPIRLGLVTYNWGKDWDLPTLMRHCEEQAYGGVELRSTHAHKVEPDLTTTQRQEVRDMFSNSPVECVGLGTACEYHSADPAVLLKNIEETKAFVRLCHDVGGSGIKVRPNGLPEGVPVEETLEQIGKALDEVAAFGADFGVEIRTEVHGRGTSDISNMITIMEHSTHPNSKVTWNCNPQDLAGDGLRENFLALRDRFALIHIHDLRAGDEKYPWTEFFGLLKETNFEGWTLVEEGSVPADIPSAMGELRNRWESLTVA